jgi:hypothetical protein
MRLITLPVKLGSDKSIANSNHLIEVEVVSTTNIRLFMVNKETPT